MKKVLTILVAITLFFVALTPDSADARRGGGGFKSGTKSYNSTPKKDTNNVQQTNNRSNTGAAANTKNQDFSAAAA